ncbi:MAG: glycoside hydrolase family 3 N-terminal domain-containing protein [Steroidobacteraceae bacterium]
MPLAAGASTSQAVDAPEARIEALLSRMTLEEKIGQLTLYGDAIRMGEDKANPARHAQAVEALREDIRAGRVGALFQGTGARSGREVQRLAVEGSRLHIPLLFGADVIHGMRTVFPIPLGEAASFDPELARRTARAAAREATALGIKWTFAPMVDIARDERWGRVSEGAGEDVYLGSLLAAARVRGFQGSSLAAPDALLACPKHFAAYGAVSAGLDYNTVDLSLVTLWQTHLPPFKAAFDAGALTTMSAFNEINGVPATANPWLLGTVLHERWGFKGFVVSDYTADEELVKHGFAADARDAARLAFNAGVDMSMQSGLYSKYLPGLVRSGAVTMARIDEAVRRVLTVKQALGLFDAPYASLDPDAEQRIGDEQTTRLAREAAQRAVVLLRNDHGLLPLRRAGQRIALIGPFASGRDELFGPWTLYGDESRAVDLATGLRAALADPASLIVVHGSRVESPLPGGIAAAVAAARQSDVVLLAVGESTGMSGEAQSRTEITIPAPQLALAQAVARTGKPLVVLLRNGRALALNGAVRDAPAILVTWFLGSQAGHAIADILFGKVAPSGHLPVSFPVESGQEPFYYDHKSTGRPSPERGDVAFTARYRTTGNLALYPFGHGLTYSPLRIDSLRLDSAQLPWDGRLVVHARVVNAGQRDAVALPQLYIHDRVASLTRPVRELKGFRQVKVAAGASSDVEFELTRADVAFVGADLERRAEPGWFDVWVGLSSTQGPGSAFELLAPGAVVPPAAAAHN